MQKSKVRLSAFAAALGVALTVTLSGTAAQAKDYAFALTIDPKANIQVTGAKDQVSACDLVYDVYKVADAKYPGPFNTDTYTYENWDKYGFQSLKDEFDAISDDRTSVPSDWRAFYTKMAELVANGTVSESAATQYKLSDLETSTGFDPIKLPEDGLYLIITHGYDPDATPDGQAVNYLDANLGYSGVAYSNYVRFTFEPTMIAAPTKYDKNGEMAGVIYTDFVYGDWKDEATIKLKSERTPLYGDLKINKRVFDYTDEETTFTFHIVDKLTGGKEYNNYASITLGENQPDRNPNLNATVDADGNVIVKHIPASLQVEVSEVYAGGRYVQYKTNPLIDKTALNPKGDPYKETEKGTIASTIAVERDKSKSAVDPLPMAEVYFADEYNTNNTTGHGIMNQGIHDGKSFNGDGNNNHKIPNKPVE